MLHGPQGATADEMARAAAEGNHPDDAVPDELRWETSLFRMARMATENRLWTMTEWISSRTGEWSGKHDYVSWSLEHNHIPAWMMLVESSKARQKEA